MPTLNLTIHIDAAALEELRKNGSVTLQVGQIPSPSLPLPSPSLPFPSNSLSPHTPVPTPTRPYPQPAHMTHTCVPTHARGEQLVLVNENSGTTRKATSKPIRTGTALGGAAQEFVEVWNGCLALPRILSMRGREKILLPFLDDQWSAENYREGIKLMAASPFLMGKNDRGWKASVEWFLRPGSLAKILEGKYDRSAKPTTAAIPEYDIDTL